MFKLNVEQVRTFCHLLCCWLQGSKDTIVQGFLAHSYQKVVEIDRKKSEVLNLTRVLVVMIIINININMFPVNVFVSILRSYLFACFVLIRCFAILT